MLRKHQAEFRDILRKTTEYNGQQIICEVTPGGGKSALPLIAAREVAEPNGFKICWVVPRDSLRRQAEESFTDLYLRRIIGHNSLIRICQNSDNVDLSRGLRGFATTYQAIVANPYIYQQEFSSRNYIFFLDEPHHVPHLSGNAWFSAIAPLAKASRLVILASGTLERHDSRPIALLPYAVAKDGLRHIDYNSCEFIQYDRYTALVEGAIVPLEFRLFDGYVEYEHKGLKTVAKSIKDGDPEVVLRNLHVMLQSQFAHQLIDRAIADWREHRMLVFPLAKVLVVAPNIRAARNYLTHLKKSYPEEKILIATSEQSTTAHQAIKRFKTSPDHNILVTVSMAYEGLDVRQITHIVCLTLIRSKPWIAQCIARANRIMPGKKVGVVYAPDDPLFNQVKQAIEENQVSAARYFDSVEKPFPQKSNGDAPPVEIDARSGITGERRIATPSEEEAAARKEIDDRVRRIARHYGHNPKTVNGHILRIFRKKRSEMNLYDLNKLKTWLVREYPTR